MVKMIALREFPIAQGQSRRIVRKDDEYEIAADQVAFHEKTGRGERKAPVKKGK